MTHIVGESTIKIARLLKDKRTQLRAVTDVIEYILESEYGDFQENASEDHVYYKAYSALYGTISADEMLTDTVKDNFNQNQES